MCPGHIPCPSCFVDDACVFVVMVVDVGVDIVFVWESGGCGVAPRFKSGDALPTSLIIPLLFDVSDDVVLVLVVFCFMISGGRMRCRCCFLVCCPVISGD